MVCRAGGRFSSAAKNALIAFFKIEYLVQIGDLLKKMLLLIRMSRERSNGGEGAPLDSFDHFDPIFYFQTRKRFSFAGGMRHGHEATGRRLHENAPLQYELKRTVRLSSIVGGTGN